jgi:hypothetical protein
MLHVTTITPLLQRIALLPLPSHLGWQIVCNVRNEIVFVCEKIGQAGGDEVEAILEKFILFNYIFG